MNILHIDSSPRTDDSVSRTLSAYLANQLAETVYNYRDLANEPFQALRSEDLVALHGSAGTGTKALASHVALSDTLIDELLEADTLIIGAPMHNFSVPATLKRWIDYVARAGKTFRYTETGPEGLAGIETAYIVVATGGAPVGGDMDFASNYLVHICKFLGVKTVHVIDAGGSNREREQSLSKARKQIDAILEQQTATA